VRHHGEGLLRETGDTDWVEIIKRDYRDAELTPPDRAMLDYVRKLTIKPVSVNENDVLRLRTSGFGDKAIFEINQITGYFAWCNRTIDGLGVEIEEFWDNPDATNV